MKEIPAIVVMTGTSITPINIWKNSYKYTRLGLIKYISWSDSYSLNYAVCLLTEKCYSINNLESLYNSRIKELICAFHRLGEYGSK